MNTKEIMSLVIIPLAILALEIFCTVASWRARPRASIALLTLLIIQLIFPLAVVIVMLVIEHFVPSMRQSTAPVKMNFGLTGMVIVFFLPLLESGLLFIGVIASPLILLSAILKKKRAQPAAGGYSPEAGEKPQP